MARDNTILRRAFLRGAAAVAAGAAFPKLIPASVLGGGGIAPPSDRILIGCIGVGGRGQAVMAGLLESADAQVIGVCDVKPECRAAAQAQAQARHGEGSCATHADFRDLVARDEIDAVSIASTDHWHVLHALAAVRAGKDIYVEKPLGVCIEDLKVLRDAVHRYGAVLQFGTQQRSDPLFRQACELSRNGRLGQVRTIRVSAPSGTAERTGSRTYEPAPIPPGFDYEMWLGPAPHAPFTPKRVINPHWFHIHEYSAGYIAGWGIHHIDIAQWGNGTDRTGPIEIEGSGVFPSDDGLCDNALTWDIDLRFANGVRIHFTSDGGPNAHGIRFEGTRGWVHVLRGGIDADPKSLLAERLGAGDLRLPASDHHQRNFLECVRSRKETISPIDVAVRSDSICHLSDIAMRLGRRLRWDPERETFAGDADANRMLARPMREPWHL
ncbi:MAG: Gfo/Idh/MocA family oxidoreductase [Planctomycetes bacterium]|nr:Gfo/Idh/MocA family oxidoreductase [Planctomycetota bacterium]